MKKDNLIRLLSVSVCVVLIAAMALFTAGCGQTGKNGTDASQAEISSFDDAKDVGEGKTAFKFTVFDENGNEKHFLVHTDEKNVGPALEKVELISGTEGDYGLMVEKVDGVEAKYETDGRYWAFYVDGSYASSSVDKTKIEPDKIYAFKNEKA